MKIYGLLKYFLIGLFLFFVRCSNNSGEKSDIIIGVKIYNYGEDLNGLFEEWDQIGINTVFTSEELFTRKGFRSNAEKFKIKTFIITPVFFDSEFLAENSEYYAVTDKGERAIDDWVEFVCPSREDYRKQKIESIKRIVKDLDPDGISIDFIRHFVFWEMVYPERTLSSLDNTCFDSICLNRFQLETNFELPVTLNSEQEKAIWIRENKLDSWIDWKCGLITGMIEEIVSEVKKIKPDILINTHIVPWRENDFEGAIKNIAGQDIRRIEPIVDYLSPMTYVHMVKQDPEWVNSVVSDFYKQTNGNILPSIQVKEAYLNDTLTISEFEKTLRSALKPPSKGVVFWSWEQFDIDVEKKELVKMILNSL
ncbi:MAG: hypothetical protein HQ541_19375 [Mariniphaga sp.]|nr:hypothetical protein [Mariniphaga sp.]